MADVVDLSVSGGLCLRLSLRSIYLTPTWSTNTKKKKDRERMIERPRLLGFRFSDIFVIVVCAVYGFIFNFALRLYLYSPVFV